MLCASWEYLIEHNGTTIHLSGFGGWMLQVFLNITYATNIAEEKGLGTRWLNERRPFDNSL